MGWLTTKELAAKLRKSPDTLVNWRYRSTRDGVLIGPVWHRIGGTIAYDENEVEEYIRASAEGPSVSESVR